MGMLGLDGVEEVLSSSRISGAVFHQLLTKPPLKQRRPLLADEVYRLEMICREGLDIRDQVFAGFMLFLVFGRARNSDTAAVQQIVWDFVGAEDGFVQVDTRNTKTSRTISKRTRFLPLISLRLGLSDEPWADSWRSARAGAGLEDSRNDGSEFPLMPAPLLSGGWSDRPLNASEVRKWAMELLLSGDPGTELEFLGSHSGKATTLSWMSKVGASPDVRRHLGYHVQPGDISMLTYSRDAAAEPLRQLAKMIALIRTGHFDPDKSRSGYMSSDLRAYGFDNWVNKNRDDFHEDDCVVQFAEGESEVGIRSNSEGVEFDLPRKLASPSSSDHVNSDTSGSSSSDDEDKVADVIVDSLPVVREPVEGLEQKELQAGNLFFHTTFCTVHCIAPSDPSRFKCGRVLRSAYSKVESITFEWPKCMDCFRTNRVPL